MENKNKPTEEPSYTGGLPDYTQQANVNKRRRLLIPIILVIAITVIYQILSWISNRKQVEKKVEPPVATQAIQTPAPSSTQPVAEAVIPPTDALTQQVNTLTQAINEDRAQIAKINNALNNQQTALNSLNVSVADLAASLDMLRQNVDTVIAKIKAPAKKKSRKSKPYRIAYHIKAIVPGRAWLEDPYGRTVSVRVGNRLNGTRVEWISSLQGVVTLSSGEIIQYGANDF